MKTIEVVAAIIIKNNKFLCCQRGNYGDIPLKWEFPGGKIENFETKEKALIREIKEELNVEIYNLKFFKTVNCDYPDFHLIMHSYLCEIIDEEIDLQVHVNSRWLEKEELLTLDWALADLPIVFDLINDKR